MAVISYGIVLDISDSTSDTNSAIGLESGVFYWITGRPGYSGSGYSGDAPASKTWGQGIITDKKKISPVVRIMEGIEVSGGYGSLSGFNFEIDNTSKFWNILDSNSYYIINRPIDLYVFLDDVSYQVWGGLVSRVTYDQVRYKIICEDDFKIVHKAFPPTVVTDTNFPEVNSKSEGKVIPVCMGNVPYAKFLNVSTKTTRIALTEVDNTERYAASLRSFTKATRKVVINTAGKSFAADTLKGYFLNGIVGIDESFKITANGDTDTSGGQLEYNTELTISGWFTREPDSPITGNVDEDGSTDRLFDNSGTFTSDGIRVGATVQNTTDGSEARVIKVKSDSTIQTSDLEGGSDNTWENGDAYSISAGNSTGSSAASSSSADIWYFEIVDLNSLLIVSEDDIEEIKLKTNSNEFDIFYWEKNVERFFALSELLNQYNYSSIESSGYPGIKLLSRTLELDGDIKKTFTLKPTSVKMRGPGWSVTGGSISNNTFESYTDEQTLLNDGDDTTYYELDASNAGGANLVLDAWFILEFPDLSVYDFDNVGVLFYWTVFVSNNSNLTLRRTVAGRDYMERITEEISGPLGPLWSYPSPYSSLITGSTLETYREIPQSHFNEPEDDDLYFAITDRVDVSGFMAKTGSAKAYNKLDARFQATLAPGGLSLTANLDFVEIAIVGQKNLNLVNETVYARLIGESVSSNITDNVYRAIQHILETYDGISSSDIDYGNLAAERAAWKLGRQVTERKTSNKYLKEIAQQSFLGIFPTREGKRGISAWLENTTAVATHDESEIKRIKSFGKTPISKVYNDITVNYQSNPGTGKYDKSIYITNTGPSATFPEIYEGQGTDQTRTWDSAEIRFLGAGWTLIVDFSSEPTWASVGDYISLVGTGNFQIYFAQINAIVDYGGGSYAIGAVFTNTTSVLVGDTETSGTLYHHESSIPKWTTYAGGFTDYTTAKSYWEICQNSYDEIRTLNRLEINSDWFIDNELFNPGTGGSGNSAYYLMQLLTSWATRQKYVVTYTLPINASNLQLELLDPITFNDAVYTNSTDLTGWITKIKLNPAQGTMDIDLILEPADIESIGLIIETGSAPDTITESGSQPDTITEGQQ